MRIVFILLLFVCAHSSGYTQTPSASPGPKHRTKVETKYDARKNETEARIGPLELWKPPGSVSAGLNFERVDLVVYFSYSGKKVVTPKLVTFLVFSKTIGGQPQFERERNISISTDSGDHNFGDLELLSTSQSRVSTGDAYPLTMATLTQEVVRKAIPFDDFTQIAQARTAQIKLADRKFKFTKEHLEAFRNFLMLMQQQGLEF
jgi:hypothetical protein